MSVAPIVLSVVSRRPRPRNIAVLAVAAMVVFVLSSAQAAPPVEERSAAAGGDTAHFEWEMEDITGSSCGDVILPGAESPPGGIPEQRLASEFQDISHWESWIDDWWVWARSESGVEASPTQLLSVITASPDAELRLMGVDVRVHSRAPAPQGVRLDSLCLRPPYQSTIGVDLDREPVAVVAPHVLTPPADSPFPEPRIPPIDGFPHVLAPGESAGFLLWVSAYYCDCTWSADLHWSSDGAEGTITIDDDGNPFRTVGAALSDSYEFDWRVENWNWAAPRYESIIDE